MRLETLRYMQTCKAAVKTIKGLPLKRKRPILKGIGEGIEGVVVPHPNKCGNEPYGNVAPLLLPLLLTLDCVFLTVEGQIFYSFDCSCNECA